MDIDTFLKQQYDTAPVPEESPIDAVQKSKKRSRLIVFIAGIAIMVLGVLYQMTPPRSFPVDQFIEIEKGSGLSTVARILKQEQVIRSSQVFQIIVKVSGNAQSLRAGDYVFERPMSVWTIARHVARGIYGKNFVRLTIPEGSSLQDIATIAEAHLVDFNPDYFIEQAIPYNGYLFPDTYFLFPSTTEDELIARMRDEFSTKIKEAYSENITTMTPELLRDKVIMASIVEREAAGKDDSAIIAGILYKRIKIGMPLQVDASFAYLFNKESSELTLDDLKFDSPYNTYTNKGLPPGPLGNPGLLALDAAFHPAQSPYLYYLHDSDGNAHFAKNFNEHISNKKKYLNR